jgi:hypothetical protein
MPAFSSVSTAEAENCEHMVVAKMAPEQISRKIQCSKIVPQLLQAETL